MMSSAGCGEGPVPGRRAGEVEMVVEIRFVDGPAGDELVRRQARVLREVTEWLVRNRSEHGRERAA
ncbi:hypothetical protein [Saccharothrix lopnurensis]|uniref:Uncharacterized protein n=1 Tax=Saccharothrix lopnurensis TaxID=1670621 RepID=A0ABW1PD40_9PSEU